MSDLSQSADCENCENDEPSSANELAPTLNESTSSNHCEFHVCAIGASAGGLEPIQTFFSCLHEDLGIAYIVIQHLSPTHESQMPQLLGRVVNMPVELVTETDQGLQLAPDHIYLIPPGKDMAVQNGRLFLSDRVESEQLSLPIDHFFLSLAQDIGRFAVAIVMSGTGGDGSAGIEDVHRTGGLVMAQDPRTCRFESMPERAIATGKCDVVLPPAGLADALTRYVRQSLSRDEVDELELGVRIEPACQRILEYLQDHSALDFSIYKPSTIVRRIERRRDLLTFSSIEEYAELLQSTAEERERLLDDLLIGVTSFFRNKEAFEALQHEAITKIVSQKSSDDELRIWIAGCATGEEAYTIAIILNETAQRLDKQIPIKIFATDANQRAIETASNGNFSESAMSDLPLSLRDKYFTKQGEGYKVNAMLRQQIVFVQHDLMKDAPFTKMDLVSCRNLLIYLQSHAQTKCLSLFHFSLKPGGFLLLGSSESIGELEEEFESVSKKWRLYRKLRDVQLATLRAEAVRRATGNKIKAGLSEYHRTLQFDADPGSLARAERFRLSDQHLQQAYDALLEKLLPAGFLIDREGHLLHTFGEGGSFLRLQSGRHSTQIVDLIHPDLRSSVSAAMQHCQRNRKQVVYSGVAMDVGSKSHGRYLDISAEPLIKSAEGVSLILVSIENVDAEKLPADDITRIDASEQTLDRVKTLENELLFTRENLQATIQELESSNEELQATNEEMVASNEELQGTNEELQSVNEELHTVNAEYHRKINQLQEAEDDMTNLLSSSDVAVLFLDKELRLRRFTPSLAVLAGFRAADQGRSIHDFQTKLVPPHLVQLFEKVLEERVAATSEIESFEGRTYSVRVTPFESTSIADGVVITFVDSTLMRQREDSAKRWASIVESTADCIIAMDLAGNITQWNPAAERLYGYTESQAVGQTFQDLVVPRAERGETAMRIEQARGDKTATQFNTLRVTKDGDLLSITARLSPVFGNSGIVGISSIERDVTDQKRRAKLQAFEERVRVNSFLDRSTGEGLGEFDKAITDALGSRALWVWRVDELTGELRAEYSSFGQGEAEWLAANGLDLGMLAHKTRESQKRIHRLVETAPPNRPEDVVPTENGESLPNWRLLFKPLIHREECVGVIAVLLDMPSDNKLDEVRATLNIISRTLAIQVYDEARIDELLRVSEIVENASEFVGTFDYQGKLISMNRAGRLLAGIGLDDDVTEIWIGELLSQESRDLVFTESLPEATRAGRWNGEVVLLDRRGNTLPLSLLITSHRDDQGRLRYFSTIARVLSEQKEILHRLEELLRETKRDSDAKTTFLANVSHDVRTPMTSVIGFAELLMDAEMPNEQKSMVRSILESGRFVTELLNDLLDLSKVESGRLTITTAPELLTELFEDLERAYQPIAKSAGLRLLFDLTTLPTVPVMIDRTRVRQIVENLLSNAIKFTETGQVKLVTAFDDECISIHVIDSGCGIENSMIASVFDPYFQSSPTSNRRVRGAGLGLAISRKLAEQMGGQLSLKSESGTGSHFTFEIPFERAELSSEDAEENESDYPAEERPLSGLRILVAEDTQAIQFLLQRILTAEGMIVEVVDNGKDAFERIVNSENDAKPYAALILDMQMPIMDGYEAARALRAGGSALPIIAMTASTMQAEQTASLEAGCNRFLPKPIDKTELLTTIWQLVR